MNSHLNGFSTDRRPVASPENRPHTALKAEN
jgi:hypothetical protein